MDLRIADKETKLSAKKYLEEANKKYPEKLVKIEIPDIERIGRGLIELWRSRYFLVQIYTISNDIERITVNRTSIDSDGSWVDNISWDELQDIKEQCGRGEFEAVEIYPKSSKVVNVANMRHLWLLRNDQISFVWKKNNG